MNNNMIDINPEYQREVVWTADRMSQLIDSLMENYYIPPIIFNRQTNKQTGKAIYVCVDGKQRLSSVQAFVRGIIPCQDIRGEKWWFKNAHVQGKNKNLLSAIAQEEFLSKDFVTFEYTDLETQQEEDLFARVQMGMPLSTAEKMRATSGPWQDLARHFSNDFPVIYSLQKDRMRAKDFQLTLSCFSQILEVQHPTPSDGIPMHKASYNHLTKLVEKVNFLDDDLKSHLASVWTTLNDLIELDPDTFTNANKRLKGVQTFAPVEMIAVTVLISVHIETRKNMLLLEDIRSLRDNLRENFSDLRINGYVWKAVWSFIDNLDKNRPVSDDDMASHDVPSTAQAPPSRSAPIPVKAGAKKGRPTARTKPPTVLPEARGDRTAVKSEPIEPELDLAESRPRKRQRTGSIRDTTQAPANAERPTPAMGAQDMALRSTPTTGARTLSAFASLGAPIATPVPQKAPQRSKINTSSQDSLPTPGSTPPFIPAEAHQNRKSQPESYRAPVASMGSGLEIRTSVPRAPSRASPSAPLQSSVTRLTTMPPMTMQAPASVWENSNSPPNRKGPNPTQSTVNKPEGLTQINSQIRPSTQTHKAVPPSKSAQAMAKTARAGTKQKQKQKQKPIPQYDGVIDLTDDGNLKGDDPKAVEQERANLLSAFQGAPGKPQRAQPT